MYAGSFVLVLNYSTPRAPGSTLEWNMGKQTIGWCICSSGAVGLCARNRQGWVVSLSLTWSKQLVAQWWLSGKNVFLGLNLGFDLSVWGLQVLPVFLRDILLGWSAGFGLELASVGGELTVCSLLRGVLGKSWVGLNAEGKCCVCVKAW